MTGESVFLTHLPPHITHYFIRFCGARTVVKTVRSNKSPPAGLTVDVTAFEPSLCVRRYSPLGCFFGAPASKNLNNPQVPGYFNDDESVCKLLEFVLVANGLVLVGFVLLNALTFAAEVFAEGAVGATVELVSVVEAKFINAPVSPALAGNLNVVEPVPLESIFCPSMVTSIRASFIF